MRILVATSQQAVIGGVETYLRAVLPALAARGHDVGLLYEYPAAQGQGRIDDRIASSERWRLGDPSALQRASAWRPDVCFLQGLAECSHEEALVERFPTILFAHNYYGTCISGSKCRAFPVHAPCERTLGVGCLANYLPRRCGGLNPVTMLLQYRAQRRRQVLLSRYRGVIVASRHMREEYRRHGVPCARLHLNPLFPPGEVPDSDPPAERPVTGRILLASRLTKVKGGDLLVRAIRQASDLLKRALTLVVAGDGPERARIEALARRYGVPAEFHGWVTADKRRELMRGVDVLAISSVWPEPFGLVGLEAACVGLPTVAFAVGGIPDWLEPGIVGELASGQPSTARGLAEALARGLGEPARLARLQRGAWRMSAAFTLTSHLARLESIMEPTALARGASLALERNASCNAGTC